MGGRISLEHEAVPLSGPEFDRFTAKFPTNKRRRFLSFDWRRLRFCGRTLTFLFDLSPLLEFARRLEEYQSVRRQ